MPWGREREGLPECFRSLAWFAAVAEGGYGFKSLPASGSCGFLPAVSGLATEEVTVVTHRGILRSIGLHTPGLCIVALGGASVSGELSPEAVDGLDGHASRIVFGNLRCSRLVKD